MHSTIEETKKTEFNLKIHKLLEEKGYHNISDSNIAFLEDNLSDDVILDVNYMSSGIHFKKNEINREEIISSGFRYYPTWSYIF